MLLDLSLLHDSSGKSILTASVNMIKKLPNIVQEALI